MRVQLVMDSLMFVTCRHEDIDMAKAGIKVKDSVRQLISFGRLLDVTKSTFALF